MRLAMIDSGSGEERRVDLAAKVKCVQNSAIDIDIEDATPDLAWAWSRSGPETTRPWNIFYGNAHHVLGWVHTARPHRLRQKGTKNEPFYVFSTRNKMRWPMRPCDHRYTLNSLTDFLGLWWGNTTINAFYK
ncbi:hypothetical protein FPOA_08163 [Fusarium poae]|uniref:Uncharacterized protein n=1 Tax=Fusarium poae TaxID=36050 RepID=A0A1B8AMV8_FUSPO|nr:hypothetical protein FPOA_08163 [Fusarium poae]